MGTVALLFFCFSSISVNSLMCFWKNSSCSLPACPAATIFMTAFSSGSVPALAASMWITGSGAGVDAGPGAVWGEACWIGLGGGGRDCGGGFGGYGAWPYGWYCGGCWLCWLWFGQAPYCWGGAIFLGAARLPSFGAYSLMGKVCGSMTSWASMAPTWGKFFSISFCRALACLSASVRSDTFLGMVYFLWKVRKLTPDTHTARDRCSEALSTPLCWMFCHSVDGSSSGCGSGSVGSGWPSAMRRGSTGLEGCCDASATGVPGAESLTATLGRLRFNVDLGPFAGFSLGVSGVGGAASSRARALVDRLGSVIMGGY
jgi:hypothetical protein